MEFKEFRDVVESHFKEMTKGVTHLFEVELDKKALWNLYQDTIPADKNPIFRERREHDCSCCHRFFDLIGNVVAIKDNKMVSIWDIRLSEGNFYQPVADALAAFVKSHAVTDVYVANFAKIGTEYNFEQWSDGTLKRWDHFQVILPNRFLNKSQKTVESVQAQFRDTKNVFKRSLEDISKHSLEIVIELIAQKSLYRGEEWEHAIIELYEYLTTYLTLLDEKEKDNFAWVNSAQAGIAVGRMRNHSMGTLLVNLTEGMDIELALRKYDSIMAPANYKRPKAAFTKTMLEKAKETIIELGYMESLARRYATLDDITINNILFSNKDAGKRIQAASNMFNDMFAEMEKKVTDTPKKFSKVEEISAEDFVNRVLPVARELELYLENRHAKNMVSLIAPEFKEAKTMFKWNNNFSWAYAGNMTDSAMKERVKAAGGKVDGDLRFSIQWNDTPGYSRNDLDAHCMEPLGTHIYFRAKRSARTRGELDVDITRPERGVPAVENITWANRSTMVDGKYEFFVHQYANRGGRDGFRAEIEFDGQIYTFDYSNELRQDEKVKVADVTLQNGVFSIKTHLPSQTSSTQVWNLTTNEFIPVSVVMYSPNYWDEQKGIGHRHYFFMLKDCINPENPNGFYNEFLKSELEPHKRVFEALGAKASVKDMEDQLSGVGFASTKRDNVLVKVKGATERVLRVIF